MCTSDFSSREKKLTREIEQFQDRQRYVKNAVREECYKKAISILSAMKCPICDKFGLKASTRPSPTGRRGNLDLTEILVKCGNCSAAAKVIPLIYTLPELTAREVYQQLANYLNNVIDRLGGEDPDGDM